jgi:hypothetical protein
MSGAKQPTPELYRELAEKLRELARQSHLPDIKGDLQDLAARFERMASITRPNAGATRLPIQGKARPAKRKAALAAAGCRAGTRCLQPCLTTKETLGATWRQSLMEEPQPGAPPSASDHYREMASKLRELARQFRFPDARRELLDLAPRNERRADGLDARSTAASDQNHR